MERVKFKTFKLILFDSAQHLTGLLLLNKITNGNISGAEQKSVDVKLDPKAIKSGTHQADTRTAG